MCRHFPSLTSSIKCLHGKGEKPPASLFSANDAGGVPGMCGEPSKAGHERPSQPGPQVEWPCVLVPVSGAGFSLGGLRVSLLSLPDSLFVVNMKSYPSWCPKAFSLRFYHPLSLPCPSPPPTNMLRTSSEVPSTLVQRREPNLSTETEAVPRCLWALLALSGGLG